MKAIVFALVIVTPAMADGSCKYYHTEMTINGYIMCAPDDGTPNSPPVIPMLNVAGAIECPPDCIMTTPDHPVHLLPEDRSWHLLTQSYGGTISLLKDLTKHECEVARDLALPVYPNGEIHMTSFGEIKSAECFQ